MVSEMARAAAAWAACDVGCVIVACVQMGRRADSPIVIEYRHLASRKLEATARRTLAVGGASSLALMVLALTFWRVSKNAEKMQAKLERGPPTGLSGPNVGSLGTRNPQPAHINERTRPASG